VSSDKNLKDSRVLVLGVTFKENVSDIRNSKVVDIVSELESYGIKSIDVYDPHADAAETKHEYNIDTVSEPKGKYDAIIVAVNHEEIVKLPHSYFHNLASNNCVFVDVKGVFRNNRPEGFIYWSL
ncbi:MAG TPA: UDP binding domain-containing protein, partial [Tenuifilaceae bacterium]|nr:UDP binding domain-containing protein [Tenuifilaceae bacterium]